jgi:hypothetical protein
MTMLHTKNGKPLTVVGDDIFDQSGRHVGRRSGDKVYGLTVATSLRSLE